MADANTDTDAVQEARLTIQLPSSIGAQIEYVQTTHSLQETLSDVKEALAAAPQLSNVTHYSLVFEGQRVTDAYDDFDPLSLVLGGRTGELRLGLVEKPYNLKAVYEHLLKFRENVGMNFYDHAARAFSAGAGLSKFNSLGLKDIKVAAEAVAEAEQKKTETETVAEQKKTETETVAEQKKTETETVAEQKKAADTLSITEDDLAAVKAAVDGLVGAAELSLTAHFAAESVLSRWQLPLRSLTLSQWNPAPHPQQVKGDLLYLTVTTLEGETFAVTCHAAGFFVSRSSTARFDPARQTTGRGAFHHEYLFHNLVCRLSPGFAATLARNRQAVGAAAQFAESYLVPAPAGARFSWAVAADPLQAACVPDYSRTQLPVFAHGVDGADRAKDWNDEFQGIKEFPRGTFNERLLRDKLLSRYVQDFTQTAVAAAVDIVRGNVAPLNPNEGRAQHIFLRNSIFYSFGVDATGAHAATGGDEAARYCFAKDVAAVRLLNRVDAGGVCNLLSCVVDFLGERVVCQAPVPGVFNDQVDAAGRAVDKVAYGHSVDAGKIAADASFEEALKPVAEAFHLQPHAVELADGASSGDRQLLVSKDTKGLIGTDGRKYLIDLYRTTPVDIAFVEAHCDGDGTQAYPHREAALRHEAVQEWYKRKAAAIFKAETERLEQEGALDGDGDGDGEARPQIAMAYDQIAFNPDAYTGVNESAADQQTVREMSEFVAQHLIPEFLSDVAENAVPYDGAQLTDYMHRSGINMRYLGEVARQALQKAHDFERALEETINANEAALAAEANKTNKANKTNEAALAAEAKKKEPESAEPKREATAAKMVPVASNMKALHGICVQDMVARGAKHLLRKVASTVPALLKPHFVAHFHNCLLGGAITASPSVALDESYKKFFSADELAFTKLNAASVRASIAEEVFVRFRHSLAEDWATAVKPLQLLREIALKFGVQWKAQQYAFTKEALAALQPAEPAPEVVPTKGKKNKQKAVVQAPAPAPRTTPFVSEDIVAFVPIVKDSSYRCSFVDEVFETARLQIQDGEKQIGLDLLAELVAFYQQIYGNVHKETASFYSTLAQIYSECGLNSEASIIARKSAILHERLSGLDSYETINSYVKAAYFESLNKDHVSAFKLNVQAFKDWSVVYGADHPNTVNTFSSFATILQQMKLTSEARHFFGLALDLSVKLNGELSDITAILRHRLGVMLVQSNDYKAALEQFEKAAYAFNRTVGPSDVLSKECTNFATNLAKYMAFTEQQLAEKKKLLAQSASKKAKGAVAAARAAKPEASKTKKEKKSELASPNPEIASKSVDEILQFIEGGSSGKKSKKRN